MGFHCATRAIRTSLKVADASLYAEFSKSVDINNYFSCAKLAQRDVVKARVPPITPMFSIVDEDA